MSDNISHVSTTLLDHEGHVNMIAPIQFYHTHTFERVKRKHRFINYSISPDIGTFIFIMANLKCTP